MKTALDLLKEATKTYEERNKQYGNSYNINGAVLKALFPDGMPIARTPEEMNRQIVFHLILSKIVRYCQNYNEPHLDSIHDLGVYAFIMEELDTEFNNKKLPSGIIPYPAVNEFIHSK